MHQPILNESSEQSEVFKSLAMKDKILKQQKKQSLKYKFSREEESKKEPSLIKKSLAVG